MKTKLLIIAVAGLFLFSCKSKEATPEDTVKKFFEAVDAKDFDKAKSLATTESAAVIDMMKMGAEMGGKVESKPLSKVECVVDGETANCECWTEGVEESKKVPVKKVDGAWKVHMSKTEMMNDKKEMEEDLNAEANQIEETIDSTVNAVEEEVKEELAK